MVDKAHVTVYTQKHRTQLLDEHQEQQDPGTSKLIWSRENIPRCRSSIAAPQPEDNNDQQRTSDVEEEEEPQRINIPYLYIPDLANTILSEAIKDSMMLGTNDTEYLILTPKLNEHIGVETLKVTIPSGELEIPRNPPVKFVTKCAPHPFEEKLLLATLKDLRNHKPTIPPRKWLAHHRQ